jgi:hypothetical protein
MKMLVGMAYMMLGCTILPTIGLGQIVTPKPYLSITGFDDSWGGGFTQIKDDLRSFGFQADYQQLLYGQRVAQFTASWSGLTHKFGSTSARLDEIQLDVRLPILSFTSDWHLDGIVGGNSYGNFGGERFQNRAHEASGIPRLDLPYSNTYQNFVKVGGQVWGDIGLAEYAKSRSLRFLLIGRGVYGFAGYMDLNVTGALAFRNPWGDQVQFNLGYRYREVDENPVLDAVFGAEQGFYASYSMRLGLLYYDMTVYPTGNFSIGHLGITLFNWNERPTLERVDALAEFGSLFDANGFYLRYLWNNWTRLNEKFQFDIHYQFWTLSNDKLPAYPERYGHYQQFSLGGNYVFIKPRETFQVLPYLSLRFGYKNERTYAGEVPGPDYSVWSLNAIGEGGVRIKLPANIIHKNCYYGLTANYQYVATLYKSNDYQLVSAYPFAQSLGYFGLGGFVMIDF